MKPIYMDNAATTYPKPEPVYQAMDYFNRHLGGNPGRGSSKTTLRAGSILLDARETLAELFNVRDSSRIAFTTNVTEAINTAFKGILQPGDHVITSSMEHNSVARPLHAMSRQGIHWTRVPCEVDGSLDPERIREVIQDNTRLICLLHASNITGTIMPIAEAGKIARDNGVLFMVDSAQSAGVLPLDVEEQNIDILCFTGHKGLLGPQGTGGLYLRSGLVLRPLKEGGTGSFSEYLEHPDLMPDQLEAGTQNTPGIAGLKAGVQFILGQGLATIRRHEQRITDLLINGLKEIPGLEIHGPQNSDLQTAVVLFGIEGLDCGEVSMRLDYKYGIVTRSGLHCAPLAHQTISTLESGACRFSPGYFTTPEEIEQVIQAVYAIAREGR